jgi:hypothetical protein
VRKVLNCLEQYFLKTQTYHYREFNSEYTVLKGSQLSVEHSNLLVWILSYCNVILFHSMSQQRADRTLTVSFHFAVPYFTVTTNFRVEALTIRTI